MVHTEVLNIRGTHTKFITSNLNFNLFTHTHTRSLITAWQERTEFSPSEYRLRCTPTQQQCRGPPENQFCTAGPPTRQNKKKLCEQLEYHKMNTENKIY